MNRFRPITETMFHIWLRYAKFVVIFYDQTQNYDQNDFQIYCNPIFKNTYSPL